MSTRLLKLETAVAASLDDVWDAWTTETGLTSFLAGQVNVELRVGGPFEALFDRDQPPGSQGSEGCRVLSYLPKTMLSFDWNAPPVYPDIRQERTWVVVLFEHAGDGVNVTLSHLGWGEGGDWDEVFGYFEAAWSLVLARLQRRFAVGPIDWDDPWRPD